MHLLNFSHPLTPEQLEQIEAEIGQKIDNIIETQTHFDGEKSYVEQVVDLVDRIEFTPQQWQNEAILINPPSFNFVAVALLAELHGRMGYFPPCVRLRPVQKALPPRFEVAEILNLQEMREKARTKR